MKTGATVPNIPRLPTIPRLRPFGTITPAEPSIRVTSGADTRTTSTADTRTIS